VRWYTIQAPGDRVRVTDREIETELYIYIYAEMMIAPLSLSPQRSSEIRWGGVIYCC